MFSAFFGNYLLNENIVTRKQLDKALAHQDRTRLKLGTLAIDAGYMTATEVEELHRIQITTDKRFGELAIDAGYMTESQLEALLDQQQPRHLLLAQSLVDMKAMTFKEYEKHLTDYKKKFELDDEALEHMSNCNAKELVDQLLDFEDDENGDFYKDYLSLFIKNQIRFINSHVHFDPATRITKASYDHLIRQAIHRGTTYFTAIAGGEKALMKFAGLYADEQFKVFGEYPIDAIGEYMNQNNGLFIVNKNDEGEDISMDLQTHVEEPTLKPYRPLYDIPIHCTCGEIHLILGLL